MKIQVSSKRAKIILNSDIVEEYLRAQNEKNASTMNETVTSVDDSDSDSSLEYVKTEFASPKTKKNQENERKNFIS